MCYCRDAIDIDLHETLASAQEAQDRERGGVAIRSSSQRRVSGSHCVPEDPPSGLSCSPTLKAGLGGAGRPQLSGAGGSPALRTICMAKVSSIESSLHALAEEGQHGSLGSSYTEQKLLV